jgi:hypothetical protein
MVCECLIFINRIVNKLEYESLTLLNHNPYTICIKYKGIYR